MEFNLFSSVSEDVLYVARSPMAKDEILCGKPLGGVSLFWHKRHQHAVFPIDTISDRMVAVKVRTSLVVILMIALYMHVDYGDCTAYDEYIVELGFVEGLLDMKVHDHMALMRDFNDDLHRNEIWCSASMSSLLSEYSLVVTGMEDARSMHRSTWHSHDFCCESRIDSKCVSTHLRDVVDGFIVRDGDCALSDHWAIMVSIERVIDTNETSDDVNTCNRRLLGKEASAIDIAKFQEILEMEMDVTDIPVETAVCNEPLSCLHQHRMKVFYDSLSEAIVKSAKWSISRGKFKKGNKMGWNEEMTKLKRAASKDYYL